jgi:hypothetical protein
MKNKVQQLWLYNSGISCSEAWQIMYLWIHFNRMASVSLILWAWEVRLIEVYIQTVNDPLQVACLRPSHDRWWRSDISAAVPLCNVWQYHIQYCGFNYSLSMYIAESPLQQFATRAFIYFIFVTHLCLPAKRLLHCMPNLLTICIAYIQHV